MAAVNVAIQTIPNIVLINIIPMYRKIQLRHTDSLHLIKLASTILDRPNKSDTIRL